MLLTVAKATGQAMRTVLHDPFALTLWTFLQIQDDQRIAGLVSRSTRLDMAGLVAIAFHEPKGLGDVRAELHEGLGIRKSSEDALSRGRDIVARLAAAEASASTQAS